MMKRVLSVVLGIVGTSVVFFALEFALHLVFPPPAGMNFQDPQAVAAFIAGLPVAAFLLMLITFALGSLVGGLIATRVSKEPGPRPALMVGILLTAFGIMNLRAVAHPMWFSVASTLIYCPFSWLGFRIRK